MPCMYYTPEEERRMNEQKVQETLLAQRSVLNETTALLCSACQSMEEKGFEMSPQLQAWWKRHQEMDRARIQKEEQDKALAAQKKAKEKQAVLKALKEQQEALARKIAQLNKESEG